MPTPKIEVKYGPITRRLHMLKRNGESLEKPLKQIGEIILSSVEENFLNEGRYESTGSWRGGTMRWKDLKPATKKARARKGKWPGKKLQVSGQLAASFNAVVKGDNLEIGSNKVYAARQHKERPILVVQEADLDDAMDILGTHINPSTT